MTNASSQRRSLVDALREAGPDAPTLCAGWNTRDLAAHLVTRERRPDSMPGLIIGPLARWTDRVRTSYAARPYEELLDQIASGPPRFSPMAVPRIDEVLNLAEYFIHCEDVRRAGPEWVPRPLDPALQEEFWNTLRTRGRAFFRRSPVAVVLAMPDGGPRLAVGGDGPHVVLTGEPAELLLYSTGRGSHARVDVTGAPEAVRRFAELKLGM